MPNIEFNMIKNEQCLQLSQTSIPNQKFPHNGLVEYKVDSSFQIQKIINIFQLDTKDTLIVTSCLPQLGVTAIRRFHRINNENDSEKSRRHSVL